MFAYLALPSCSLLLTYDTSLAIRFLSFKPGKQLFCLNKCGLRNDISSKTRAAIPLYRARERTNESIKPISRAIPRAGSLRDVKSGIVDSREVSEGPSVSSSGIGSIRCISLSSISYGRGRKTDSRSEHLGCEGAASAAVVRFYPFESRSTGGSSSESLSRAKKKRDGIRASKGLR